MFNLYNSSKWLQNLLGKCVNESQKCVFELLKCIEIRNFVCSWFTSICASKRDKDGKISKRPHFFRNVTFYSVVKMLALSCWSKLAMFTFS